MGFLVRFLEKWMKSANLGNFGVLRRDIGIPCSSVGPYQGVACPHHGVAEREGEGLPQRSTFHRHVFCHVLLFRYFKDLSIGLMRTL